MTLFRKMVFEEFNRRFDVGESTSNNDLWLKVPDVWDIKGDINERPDGSIVINGVGVDVEIFGDISHGVYSDGQERWYKGNRLHREDGPAVITWDKKKFYYINGNQMNRAEYFRHFEEE